MLVNTKPCKIDIGLLAEAIFPYALDHVTHSVFNKVRSTLRIPINTDLQLSVPRGLYTKWELNNHVS